MTALRALVVTALLVVAVSLQTAFFSHLSLDGVSPDLALLLVVAAAIVRGPEYAALLGFAAGMVLDLVPPADHTAGRWALALVVVGYLTGMVRDDDRVSPLAGLALVAAGSFVGTSVFALSGLVLHDPAVSVSDAVHVVPLAVLYDLLLTPLVLPPLLALFRRLEPATEHR